MSFWSSLPRPIIGLSPMDGVTDASFRSIIARQGKPDVMFTEFTHVHDVCRGPEILLETLIYSEIERPMVLWEGSRAFLSSGSRGLRVGL
jgi:tRNA-dihydrouridine synthase